MPAVTTSEFLTALPDAFDGFNSATIAFWLDHTEALHCPASKWVTPFNDSEIDQALDRQKKAIIFMTAHILECMAQQMAQSASIGAAIEQGQAVNLSASITNDLDQTFYGRQFKEIRRLLPTTGFAF